MDGFRVMCVPPLHSFMSFTESKYVSICAFTYVPFSMYMYALVLMRMRDG
jgi:hypothetical protein